MGPDHSSHWACSMLKLHTKTIAVVGAAHKIDNCCAKRCDCNYRLCAVYMYNSCQGMYGRVLMAANQVTVRLLETAAAATSAGLAEATSDDIPDMWKPHSCKDADVGPGPKHTCNM